MRHVVAVIGVLALGVAVALVIGLRTTRRTARTPLAPDAAFGDRLADAAGGTIGMVAGASAAGLLVLGFGGRLMMRVLAVTSSADAQGRTTDADEVVGQVSVSGTTFIVVALGVGTGLVALVAYVALRRWLPERSAVAGLVTAGIGAGILARPIGLVDPTNRDFDLLAPRWLAVTLCVGLIGVFGPLLGILVDRWGPTWPRPAWSPRGVASVLPLAPLAVAPVLLVVVVAVVLVRAVLQARGRTEPRAAAAFGRFAVVALGALGGAWTLVAAGQILSG